MKRIESRNMASTSTSDSRLLIDDYYFSALCDDEKVFPISDEKYTQELQLEKALMSSAISSTMKSESRVEEETSESSRSQPGKWSSTIAAPTRFVYRKIYQR